MSATDSIKANWKKIVRRYNQPNPWKSNWQIASSVLPYLGSWWLAYEAYQYSWALCLLVSLVAHVFLLRIFIVMHDCGHVSFYKSKTMCNIIGFFCGSLTFSPFQQWAKAHSIHHRHNGNLDQRGIGDIHLMTVEEYQNSTFWQKVGYKILRSPFFFLVLGPVYVFIVKHRFTTKKDTWKERLSVHGTNIAIVAFGGVMSYFAGWDFFLLYQLSTVTLTAMVGIFLFYVQHQYENVYWAKSDKWDYFEASMAGSSYLKLPRVFQWATGNIGFHHIHHLYSSIPNYNLEKAYKENEFLQSCTELNIRESLRCLFLTLYDTEKGELISFKEYRNRNKKKVPALQL